MLEKNPDLKIDLLTDEDRTQVEDMTRLERPKKRFGWKKILGAVFIVAIIAWAIFSSTIAFSNEGLIKNLAKFQFLDQVGKLILSSDRQLQGEVDDRINFLVAGIGGGNHDGANLADTIILGSYKPSLKQAAMLSIPRDLYVKDDGRGWMKINAVSAYAEKNKAGSGGEALKNFLSQTLDAPIQYYAVIDFDGFEKLIDEFGGVDVVVDNDLIDYEYPIRGREDVYPISSRYEKLIIKKGLHHFDGATALKYARSRHALGSEGSDFARSKRQQKIIVALKDKIFKMSTLLNPGKINSLMKAYNENVKTNIQVWEIIRLASLVKDTDNSKIIHFNLTDGADSLLRATMINGAYVLLPKSGSYEKIKFAWKNIFNSDFNQSLLKNIPDVYDNSFDEIKNLEGKMPTSTATSSLDTKALSASSSPEAQVLFEEDPPAPAAPTTSYKNEGAKIEILNGTNITGWAASEKSKLAVKGFKVIAAGNAPTKDYTKIMIYDLSGEAYPLTTSELQKIYGASVKTSLPSGITAQGEIIIILGKK